MPTQIELEQLEKLIKPELVLLSGSITALQFTLKYQKEKIPPEIWQVYLACVQREIQKVIDEVK